MCLQTIIGRGQSDGERRGIGTGITLPTFPAQVFRAQRRVAHGIAEKFPSAFVEIRWPRGRLGWKA
jgi:hypothetical protein